MTVRQEKDGSFSQQSLLKRNINIWHISVFPRVMENAHAQCLVGCLIR